jgi:predicted ATP-grasp superfamily ATP-dependent carboligase
MTRRRILVTDGTQRSALAVVRSLGRAGHAVFVCAVRTPSIAGESRHAVAQGTVADALHAPEQFVSDIQNRIEQWRIDMLIPITEASLLALLPERDGLGVTIPFPDASVFRAVADKEALLAAAPRAGIAVPRQLVLHSADDMRGIDPSLLDYPVVLKPSRSVGEHDGHRVAMGVQHAADAVALGRAVAGMSQAAFPLLVQQRIVGPGTGVFLLIWEGKLLASFSHRRLREKPPSGGVSVYSESVVADDDLIERSRLLLEQFGWNGVAMVEYKRELRTGIPYLMEVNGRFWGSLQLAVDAGVDFPALLVDAASGNAPSPVTSYRTGVRSRWWWGDFDHLLARWRGSAESLALPPDAPSRLRATFAFLTFWHSHDRSDVFRVSDARPFLHETIEWFRRR